jgi:hypothetical protein
VLYKKRIAVVKSSRTSGTPFSEVRISTQGTRISAQWMLFQPEEFWENPKG